MKISSLIYRNSLIVCFIGLIIATDNREKLPAAQLRSDLLENYDPVVRPVLSSVTVTNISYDAAIYELVGFDTIGQTVQMIMFQRVEWYDQLLVWDPEQYSGLESVRFSRTEIWTPDILPYNDVGTFDETKYDNIIPLDVNSSGYVHWFRPVDYETTCILDVTNFPFDSQYCEISIGSWQYQDYEVEIKCESGVDLTLYVTDSLWSLERANCQSSYKNSSRGVYSQVIVSMNFRRLSSFYVKNLIVPNALLLALSSLIFFIPGEIGEKIGFGVTVNLTLLVNLSIVTDFLPQTSKTFPVLFNYFLSSIVLSGLSIVLSTISINLVFPDPQNDIAPVGLANNVPMHRQLSANNQNPAIKPQNRRKKTLNFDKFDPRNWLKKVKRQMEKKLTRRKLDMIIGTVYFVGILIYSIAFFCAMQQG